MKKFIFAISFCFVVTATVEAKQYRLIIKTVPPPPTVLIPRDTSFRDNCALIALDHVLDNNNADLTKENRTEIIASAWKLADEMEQERLSRIVK